jgi:hypothetical protein
MTRVLTFDGEKGPKRFELCRTAILSAGDGKGERNRQAIRSEARLLDALDTVSVLGDPVVASAADPETRKLKPEGGTITISQEDHDRLSKYADATPWTPRFSRQAVDLQDWLSAAEKVDE